MPRPKSSLHGLTSYFGGRISPFAFLKMGNFRAVFPRKFWRQRQRDSGRKNLDFQHVKIANSLPKIALLVPRESAIFGFSSNIEARDFQISGFSDFRISGFPVCQISGCPDFRSSGFSNDSNDSSVFGPSPLLRVSTPPLAPKVFVVSQTESRQKKVTERSRE